jgi:diguanylate cyclase (GGDEF)-like protein
MKHHASQITAMRPVVAALAEMTAQRDEPSLVRRLFIAIDDIWSGAACWLVRTPPECYASEDNLIVLGDAPGMPVSLAVIGLQLKSRDSINQYYYDARHFILAHIAQPGGIDEDLLVVQVEAELGENDMALFRDLLQVYKNHLASLAIGDRDVLTGLPRKKTFLDRVTEQIDARLSGRRYRAEGNADYLAVITPDNFRAFNDEHGHFLGDLLLRALARALEETLREGDLLFRLGGKEFAVIVYDLSLEEVIDVCERIRARVADQVLVNDLCIGISIGCAALSAPALPQDILDEARQALAQAVEEGGNRVCRADEAHADVPDDATADEGKHIELF